MNVTGVSPVRVAVAVKAPAIRLAVSRGDVATPLEFVCTVTPPPKVALGPTIGVPKVTFTFGTGFWLASVTVTAKAWAY